MTKAELIFKIAKRAGIPETEAKVFFESFLKKITANINAGGAVHLDNLGVFIIKEGVSENLNSRKHEPRIEHKFTELVIFQPEEAFDEKHPNTIEESSSLIFNIPNTKNENVSNIDSYFSLSFNKPVINQSSEADTGQYYPVSRNEQKRLLETKAEKLFSEVTVYDQFGKESEKYFYLAPHKPDSDFLTNDSKNVKQSEVKPEEVIKEEFSRVQDDSSWNLGKEIQKEIVEESILDIELEDDGIDLSKIVKENLAWDFGSGSTPSAEEDEALNDIIPDKTESETEQPQAELKEPNTAAEDTYATENDFAEDEDDVSWDFGKGEDDIPDELEKIDREFLQPGLVPVFGEEKKKNDDEFVSDVLKKIPEETLTPDMSAFESVNSITSELQRLTVVEDQLNWDFGRSESENELPVGQKSIIDEIPREDGFVQLSGRDTKIVDTSPAAPSRDTVMGRSLINEGSASEFKPVTGIEKEPSFLQKLLKITVFGLIGILVALLGVYSYFKFIKNVDLINNIKSQQALTTVEPKNPEVVERSYEVPVTYPYDKKPAQAGTDANLSLPAESGQLEQAKKEDAKQPSAAYSSATEEQTFSSQNPGNILNKKDAKAEKQKEELLKAEKLAAEKKAKLDAANKEKLEAKQQAKQEAKQNDMPKPGDHSFFDGSKYVIQVSSWPTKQKADEGAEKLKKLGYSAFVTSAYIEAKKSTWYRVRVGGFNSKEEAEKAYSKLFK